MRRNETLERDGFSILESVFAPHEVDWILDEFKALPASEGISTRGGKVFAVRNLFEKLPSLRSVADRDLVKSLVRQLVGDEARPVRSLFFDKNSAANWNVAWHQDLTIAVRRECPMEGFGPWTLKAGVPHVQPPFPILERMLAVRIHLDDADESNGALRVIPGSHRLGRLSPGAIEQLTATNHRICAIGAGGVLFMKRLLLPSSLSCKSPGHRRVLHLEFSADRLPGKLEWYGH
jgi:hypothetical protein